MLIRPFEFEDCLNASADVDFPDIPGEVTIDLVITEPRSAKPVVLISHKPHRNIEPILSWHTPFTNWWSFPHFAHCVASLNVSSSLRMNELHELGKVLVLFLDSMVRIEEIGELEGKNSLFWKGTICKRPLNSDSSTRISSKFPSTSFTSTVK